MTSKNSKRKATAPVKKNVIAIEEIEKEEESTDEVCIFF